MRHLLLAGLLVLTPQLALAEGEDFQPEYETCTTLEDQPGSPQLCIMKRHPTLWVLHMEYYYDGFILETSDYEHTFLTQEACMEHRHHASLEMFQAINKRDRIKGVGFNSHCSELDLWLEDTQ